MPPGTAFRNEAIQLLKVVPVLEIPSAITSRPSTVWEINQPRYAQTIDQPTPTVSAKTRRKAGQRRSGYTLIITRDDKLLRPVGTHPHLSDGVLYLDRHRHVELANRQLSRGGRGSANVVHRRGRAGIRQVADVDHLSELDAGGTCHRLRAAVSVGDRERSSFSLGCLGISQAKAHAYVGGSALLDQSVKSVAHRVDAAPSELQLLAC